MTENLLVSLNDIEEKEASWLVPQRMPKGQIIILAGDGGSGKTSCWCSLAAAISTGAQVFFDETPKEFFESEPQKVLFFSSEDSLEYEKRWKQLNDECEAIDNQYSGRPEQRFVQSLLLGVVAELEREASHEGKTEATTTTQP